ncbi:uncharacterized protein K02A2.6-like [Ornithodoros turicata]|uniref:uncharacterized protein K02A2.6-like n=1 Tax=Ornithodoros turicata TaxID=34597 RepID=UPI003139A965
MKMLSRQNVWWPGLDTDVENVVRNCHVCQCVQNSAPLPPLQPWPSSTRVFQRVHLDFAQKDGTNFLIVVDDYSKWMEVIMMPTTTAQRTVEELRTIFAQFGLPEEAVTDNGPQFVSEEFRNFMEENGVIHTTTPPYHAASNGLAERAVQTLKKSLLKQLEEDKSDNKKRSMQLKLSNFLFQYRTTPHATTEKTPAELFLGRLPRTRLSLLKPGYDHARRAKQNRMKMYADKRRSRPRTFQVGSLIWVKNVRGEDVNWSPGKVIKVISEVTFLVRVLGKVRFVHSDHLRSRTGAVAGSDDSSQQQSAETSESSDNEYFDVPGTSRIPSGDSSSVESVPDEEHRRSKRVARPPDRLTYEALGEPM